MKRTPKFKILHLKPFIMKRKILNLAFSVSLSVGCLTQINAQDAQIKFFGQPEFEYRSLSEQGIPTDWAPGLVTPSASNPAGMGLNTTTRDTSNTNFNTGKLVLFVTAQLNDRISVLSENSMYANTTATGTTLNFEIERLLLRYYLKDYFSVRVGKMFVPMGYWNNQYNLGLVLQPTIRRPLVIRNSSDGGVLQIKDVGFQLEGDEITKLRLFYRALISNGTGFNGTNDKKVNSVAFTGQVGIEPIDGLKLLVSGNTSQIYKGQQNLNGVTLEDGRQTLINASIAFMNPEKKVEFIGEYYQTTTNFDSLENSHSHGYFGYAGYKVTNKFIPYLMYSYSQGGTKNNSDMYFIGVHGILVNVTELVLGVRYKISSNFVMKLEYVNSATKYTYQKDKFTIPAAFFVNDSDKTGFEKYSSVRAQFAFVF